MDNNLIDINILYDKYAKSLYNTALRITQSPFDAEEAMHTTFITLYNYKQKDKIENIVAWLKMVCIRKALDIIRAKAKEEIFIKKLSEEEETNITINESDKNKVEKIKQVINMLPDKYRIILSLTLFEGYDYQEIAQITGASESTIRSWYSRGKMQVLKLI